MPKASEVLSGIEKQDVVLPVFQGETAWSKDHAKQLMVSFTKAHPVGALPPWKTDNPPELKNVDALAEKLGR